jgi:hypothetical protein
LLHRFKRVMGSESCGNSGGGGTESGGVARAVGAVGVVIIHENEDILLSEVGVKKR